MINHAASHLAEMNPFLAECVLNQELVCDCVRLTCELLENARLDEALIYVLEAKLTLPPSSLIDLVLAQCYLRNQMAAEAVRILKGIVSGQSPESNRPMLSITNIADLALPHFVDGMIRLGKLDESLDICLTSYRCEGVGGQGILGVASLLEKLGDYRNALCLYKVLLDASQFRNEKIKAWRSALFLCLQTNDFDGVTELLKNNEIMPPSIQAGFQTDDPRIVIEAKTFYLLGHRNRALEKTKQYLKAAPNNVGFLCEMTCAATAFGDKDFADLCMSEVLEHCLPTDSVRFLCTVAERLLEAGDIEQSFYTYELALRTDKTCVRAHNGLRRVALVRKYSGKQAQKYGVSSHLYSGRRYLMRGQYEKSKSEYLLSIHNDGISDEAITGLISCYRALGQYAKVVEISDRFACLSSLPLEKAQQSYDYYSLSGENDKHDLSYETFRLAEKSLCPEIPEGCSVGVRPNILIASPVRQKPSILREFLSGLAELDTTGMKVDYIFIDDNDDPVSRQMLGAFRPPKGKVYLYSAGMQDTSRTYVCDDVTHHWTPDLMNKVGNFKDGIIEAALKMDYDYVFFVDSDLVLHSQTLNHLLWVNREIVSEVFWTKWKPDSPELPQVWLKDQYSLFDARPNEKLDQHEIQRRAVQFVSSLTVPGLYQVGGLGACTLIKRKVLEAGVRFRSIDNISLSGEDRFFCVRARAMGFDLYADTTYPPLHLYRDEELSNLDEFRARVSEGAFEREFILLRDISTNHASESSYAISGHNDRSRYLTISSNAPIGRKYRLPRCNFRRRVKISNNKLTLSMLVRNEADRYLRIVLQNAAEYIDEAVILDDASTDDTVEVCRQIMDEAGIPLVILSNKESGFHNEVELRRQQWEMTLTTEPDWILCLDADEVFESRIKRQVSQFTNQDRFDVFYFRLFDMWDSEHYRDDEHWKAHENYYPFLVRYQPYFEYAWKDSPIHCGRFPLNIGMLSFFCSDIRIKHLGWADPNDRKCKYQRYMMTDPQGKYGVLKQYESILDHEPTLVRWRDETEG